MDERYCNYFNMNKVAEAVSKLRSGVYKVCAFGAGEIGTGVGVDFVHNMGQKIELYCDNNPEKWGKEIAPGIFCISPAELAEMKEETVCFALVGRKPVCAVCEQLYSMGIDAVIPYDDVVMQIFLKDTFYDFDYQSQREKSRTQKIKVEEDKELRPKKDRIAVYTCVVGNYDKIEEPEVVSDICDYYYISDKRPEGLKVFQWRDVRECVPGEVTNPNFVNRYAKMHPHKLFPEYKYSIYMDGNIRILNDVSDYVNKIGASGIATHRHPKRDCVYQEGIVCSGYHMDDPEKIKNQMKAYFEQGMPSGFGLFELNVLVREHHRPICRDIMEQWWQELNARTRRDQLSFTYVLWKNGLGKEDVGVICENVGMNPDILVVMHESKK